MFAKSNIGIWAAICFLLFTSLFNANGQDYQVIGDSIYEGAWKFKGPNNQTGAIISAQYDRQDSSYTLLSESGYVFYRKESGVEWKSVNDQQKFDNPVGFCRYTDQGKSHLIVAQENGYVYQSSDMGKSWTKSAGLERIEEFCFVQKIIQGPNGDVYLLVEERLGQTELSLYESNDIGVSFSKIKTFTSPIALTINNYDISPLKNSDSSILVAYVDTLGLYNCFTDSMTYHSRIPAFGFGECRVTGTVINDTEHLYLIRGTSIYEYQNSQNFWLPRAQLPTGTNSPYCFSVSSQKFEHVAIGGELLYKSSDTGKTWSAQNSHADFLNNKLRNLHKGINYISSTININNQEFQFVATNGGFYISQDRYSSVLNLSTQALHNFDLYDLAMLKGDISKSFFAAKHQGLHKYSNETTDSLFEINPVYWSTTFSISSSNSANSLWAITDKLVGLMQNLNNTSFDATWRYTDSLIIGAAKPTITVDPGNPFKAVATGLYLKNDPNKASHIYELILNSNDIIVTKNQKNFNLSFSKSEFVEAFDYDKINTSNWYLITNEGNFYYSTDAGSTWKRSAFFSGLLADKNFGTVIKSSPTTEGTVYVGGNGNGKGSLFVSKNFGKDFSLVGEGLKNSIVHDIALSTNDSLIYTATSTGPFLYELQSNSWNSLSTNDLPLANWTCVELEERDSTVYFGTFGKGVFQFDYQYFKDSIVGLSEHVSMNNSVNVFPNPTKHSVSISSNYPITSIKLYNLEGQQLISLKTNSKNETQVDISDLPEGLYTVYVEHEKGTTVKKVLRVN